MIYCGQQRFDSRAKTVRAGCKRIREGTTCKYVGHLGLKASGPYSLSSSVQHVLCILCFKFDCPLPLSLGRKDGEYV